MRRTISQILAVVLILTGCVMFLYPMAAGYFSRHQSDHVIEQFWAEAGEQQAEDDTTKVEKNQQTEAENDLNGLYQELKTYNEQLYESGQSGISASLDYEKMPFDLTEYGLSQNVIGTLWIPRMEVELPIYLGADSGNLAKGIGLLGQTSMPVSGENTNVVLAGHRGYRGAPMFRDIQLLQIGDKLQIDTPWETRIYRVTELKIIAPTDTDEILIQSGRELLTLLTCHPYTKNYQRYMVVAEYDDTQTMQSREEDLAEAEAAYNPQPKKVLLSENGAETEVLVENKAVTPLFYEGVAEEAGADYSNFQIMMEKYGVWIFLLLAVFLIFMGKRR